MKTYVVLLREVHIQKLLINADSEEKARELAMNGEGEEYGKSYYETTLEEAQLPTIAGVLDKDAEGVTKSSQVFPL